MPETLSAYIQAGLEKEALVPIIAGIAGGLYGLHEIRKGKYMQRAYDAYTKGNYTDAMKNATVAGVNLLPFGAAALSTRLAGKMAGRLLTGNASRLTGKADTLLSKPAVAAADTGVSLPSVNPNSAKAYKLLHQAYRQRNQAAELGSGLSKINLLPNNIYGGAAGLALPLSAYAWGLTAKDQQPKQVASVPPGATPGGGF
jgi:hypothetical protein